MKRLTAWFLALTLALTLTACGGGGGKKEGLFYEASGIAPDKELLTVDGRPVPAGRYLYWLAYTCDYIAAYYASLGTVVDWSENLSGETLGEYAKSQALQNTVLYATVENWADQYDCGLTDQDQAGIAADWAEKAEEYGGEEAYLTALGRMGLDRAGAEALSADYYLYRQLYELYAQEGSPLHPETEAVERYGGDGGYLTAAWLRVPAGEDAAAARNRAAEAFAALNASPDPAGSFTALAGTYGDGGETTFAAGNGPLPENCRAAVQTLEAGQWSGIVEAEDGYYILLRRPLDLEAVSADYFDHLLQTAAEGAAVEVSKEYSSLSAGAFAAGLERARETLDSGVEDDEA